MAIHIIYLSNMFGEKKKASMSDICSANLSKVFLWYWFGYLVWSVPWNLPFKSLCVLIYLEIDCHPVIQKSEGNAKINVRLEKPLVLLLMKGLFQRGSLQSM